MNHDLIFEFIEGRGRGGGSLGDMNNRGDGSCVSKRQLIIMEVVSCFELNLCFMMAVTSIWQLY